MRSMRFMLAIIAALAAGTLLRGDAPPAQSFAQDFEKLPEGKPPAEFLNLAGDFRVRRIDGNSCLELAAHPIDSHGMLFGPDTFTRGVVSARIQGASTGKRFPEFGIGALGTGGHKLWLMPAIDELQFVKGEDIVARVPFKWASGQWIRFKLAFAVEGGKTRFAGKAWADGAAEPEKWMIEIEDPTPRKPGRASLWATPYSGQPTRFDDLEIRP